MTGYLHPGYADSLAEFGAPRRLARSGGSILVRPIPGVPSRDGMGCYPLFSCADWSRLGEDFDDLAHELVTVAVVADPFGEFAGPEFLRGCFKDLVRPFKEHYLVDLSRRPDEFVSASHRRKAHKALNIVSVERVADPCEFLTAWIHLYGVLCARHGIRGISAFSPQAFAAQLRLPGLVMFRAALDGATVGMTLWYQQGGVAFYHLGAYSAAGYESRASFGLFWFAIAHFRREGLGWLNLGGGAGLSDQAGDGLARFKRGWSTGTRTAYLCGRIFDHPTYRQLARGSEPTEYFPAYRRAEFSRIEE